ncbi:hypothetical protein ACHAWF_001038 [Thalassiosira exigua]
MYKVLNQVHPKTGISRKGMSIINSFITIFKPLSSRPGSSRPTTRRPRSCPARSTKNWLLHV